jgi:hypothetical protein
LHLNPIEFESNNEVENLFKKILSTSIFGNDLADANGEFICPECEEEFDNKDDLEKHQTVKNHFDWTESL